MRLSKVETAKREEVEVPSTSTSPQTLAGSTCGAPQVVLRAMSAARWGKKWVAGSRARCSKNPVTSEISRALSEARLSQGRLGR